MVHNYHKNHLLMKYIKHILFSIHSSCCHYTKKKCCDTKERKAEQQRRWRENKSMGVECFPSELSSARSNISDSELMTWQQKSSTSRWTGDQSRLSSLWTARPRMLKVGAGNKVTVSSEFIYITKCMCGMSACKYTHIYTIIVFKNAYLYF